jgi:acyl-CoA hydrolase
VEGRTVEHSAITMTQLVLPEQGGRAGYAHGGEIMKLMDTTAGVVGIRHAHTDLVTARVEGINFYRPIKVWDIVIINAYLTFVGRSTMEVRVEVFREDVVKEKKEHALTAYFVMVALDDQGKPTKVPPLMLTSDHERELWEQGKRRYQTCKGEIMSEDAEYKVCREEPMVFD